MTNSSSGRGAEAAVAVGMLIVLALVVNGVWGHWVDISALAGRFVPSTSTQAPDRLARLLAEMDELDERAVPYCFAGGHVTPAHPTPPPPGYYCWHTDPPRKVFDSRAAGLDCSSAVSMVLQRAGYDLPTLTSTGFVTWGKPGKGEHVTIWAKAAASDEIGHVYFEVEGRGFWGTSSENPRHGPGWHRWHDFDGYTARHPAGL